MRRVWNAEEKLQFEKALLEKGYKYIRQVDEKGNLFKKVKKAKAIKEETISL